MQATEFESVVSSCYCLLHGESLH